MLCADDQCRAGNTARSSPEYGETHGLSTSPHTSCGAASACNKVACTAPIPAYRPAHGGPLLFNRPIKGEAGKDYFKFEIPCGYCDLCRAEQARQWAVRIYHESASFQRNSFLTLSYADEHLPPNNSLNYEHLNAFTKRLKITIQRHFDVTIKYYAVGEYGDRSTRPHYHAIIFGHDFTEDRRMVRDGPKPLWTNPLLEQQWGHGIVSVGALNFATARYTASYLLKKLRSKQKYVYTDEETGELIALEQPRAFMSRNIGKDWWNTYQHQVSAHDHIIIEGRRQKPPKAYDRWLSERSEIAGEMIKEQRMKHATKLTPEQNRARARNARARAERKSKSA